MSPVDPSLLRTRVAQGELCGSWWIGVAQPASCPHLQFAFMFSFFSPAASTRVPPSRLFDIDATDDNLGLIRRSRALSLVHRGHHSGYLSTYSVFGDSSDRTSLLTRLANPENVEMGEASAMGALLGLICGEVLGLPLQSGAAETVTGMVHQLPTDYDLKPGQWGPLGSMALCLADSLLCQGGYSPADVCHRWVLWWFMGYCNPFGADGARPSRVSFGLQGAAGAALHEFTQTGRAGAPGPGGHRTDGASVARVAPVAVFYRGDRARAMDVAALQSRLTHASAEAAECCRLVAFVIVTALQTSEGPRAVLEELAHFTSPRAEVQSLALSEADWDWRAMDCEPAPAPMGAADEGALGVVRRALHCVWATDTLVDAVLRAANAGGGGAAAAALAGQIAGAVYGAAGVPPPWRSCVQRWDNGGDIALRAHHLHGRRRVAAAQSPGHREYESDAEPEEGPGGDHAPDAGAEELDDEDEDADGLGYDDEWEAGEGVWSDDEGEDGAVGGLGGMALPCGDPWALPCGDPWAACDGAGSEDQDGPARLREGDDDATPDGTGPGVCAPDAPRAPRETADECVGAAVPDSWEDV